jgi:putative DNA primase/helicase
MAVAFEAEAGRAFNDALLKTLTGGDKISARMLHANPVTFDPQFTFWLVANDRPRADVNDSGFWRRVKTLPFNAAPPGPPDQTLRDRLPMEAGPAILAWAFEGCQAWQAAGLGPAPAAVEGATAEYRASVDPIRDWLEDRCALAPHAWTVASALYDDYKGWTMGANDAPISMRDFGQHLTARIGPSTTRRIHGRKVRGYPGIGLLSPSDDDPGTVEQMEQRKSKFSHEAPPSRENFY